MTLAVRDLLPSEQRWHRTDAKLRVEQAAILYDGGDVRKVYSLPPPARHHDVLHAMSREFGISQDTHGKDMEQGFILTDGGWARRARALMIAQLRGQLIREPTAPHIGLFSEDVW